MTNKPDITKLNLKQSMPLTCSRSGACCYGKKVNLNPWELALFARTVGVSAKEFRDANTEFGGIRLLFNGETNKKGESACSQYDPGKGCRYHLGRPLVCRLYPIGRQKEGEESFYIFQGKEFPCLAECSEVLNLPQRSVGDYIEEQGIALFESVQDGYLEVMQNIAEMAFVLLLETGLSESGDTQTLSDWRSLGSGSCKELSDRVGASWIETLILPELFEYIDCPNDFINKHNEIIEDRANREFGALEAFPEISKAASQMFALALFLGEGLGASARDLSEHWINTAKLNGAREE